MVKLIKRYWNIIRRPSVHFSLGFLTVGGFIGGILFWGAFNTDVYKRQAQHQGGVDVAHRKIDLHAAGRLVH